MRRTTTIFLALCLIALVAAATGYSFRTTPQRASRTAALQDHRGGTLKLLAKAAGGTIDPQVNYTLEYWQLFQDTYDGLLGFQKAGGSLAFNVVPDLSSNLPVPTNGGKTWVFHLRKGIKFSNGKPVTVNDVVASFQRIYKVKGPNAGSFYAGIVGATACNKTPATCTLKGGVVGNAATNTVTINLVKPDSEFKYKLAVPFASIVPADSPPKDVGTKPLPGTGAYYFASYDPNKQLVMKRNPYFKVWSAAAQPDGYPDEITQSYGLTVESQITAIENGQADWTLENPPADRLGEMGTKYPSQVHIEPLTAFWYAPMNVNIAPFNNLKARQAVNYAIDRNAAIKIFGGPRLATPSCQVLPPGFPGYKPYCPYTIKPGHDLDGAGPREGEGAHEGVGRDRPAGRGRDLRRRGEQGDGGVPPERAERARLQGHGQADLGEHLLHLRAEHEEPRADPGPAVVPGLSRCVGLPLHPVRLRVVPSRQRLEHQLPGLVRQADQRPDAQGPQHRGPERGRRQRPVGEDRQGGDRPVPDGHAVHAEAHRLRLEAGRQLHLQQAVLLAGRPVVGQVGNQAGAGHAPGPRSISAQ